MSSKIFYKTIWILLQASVKLIYFRFKLFVYTDRKKDFIRTMFWYMEAMIGSKQKLFSRCLFFKSELTVVFHFGFYVQYLEVLTAERKINLIVALAIWKIVFFRRTGLS